MVQVTKKLTVEYSEAQILKLPYTTPFKLQWIQSSVGIKSDASSRTAGLKSNFVK